MKVLVAGPKWHDNSPAIAADGFRGLGHKTEIFYDNAPHWTQTAGKILRISPLRHHANKMEGAYRRKIGFDFLRAIEKFKPDLIFVIAGTRFPREVVSKVREDFRIPTVNFVVDDPNNCSRTLVYDLGAYSEIFVIDKSWMPVLEFFNPGRVHWMPHAADTLNFKPLHLRKNIDIAFGGTVSLRMPNGPSGYLRATVLNALAEENFKITAYAGGIRETFREFPALRKIEYFDGYKSHVELNELYNKAKIVLSVHSLQLKSGVSPRIFDGAVSGSFQLAEFKPELPELFPQGLKWFKNLKELVETARFYLEHDIEREQLAEQSYRYAMDHHTFKSRAQFVLNTIQSK